MSTPPTFSLPAEEDSLEGKMHHSVHNFIRFNDEGPVRNLPAIAPHQKPNISGLPRSKFNVRAARHQYSEGGNATRVPTLLREPHGEQRSDRPPLQTRHSQYP